MKDDTQEGGRRQSEKAPYNDTEVVIPPAYLLTHVCTTCSELHLSCLCIVSSQCLFSRLRLTCFLTMLHIPADRQYMGHLECDVHVLFMADASFQLV